MSFRVINAAPRVPAPLVRGLDQSIPRFGRAMRRTVDENVVIARDVTALRRALANVSVDVVQLVVGTEYRLTASMTVSHGMTVKWAPGATIIRRDAAVAPEFIVNAPGASVVLEGLHLFVPVTILSQTECRDLKVASAYAGTGGALLDVSGAGAARSGIRGCRGLDGTAAIGVQIDAAASGARVIDNDFSLNATPFRLAAAGGHHYGTLTGLVSDVNHGAVTLF